MAQELPIKDPKYNYGKTCTKGNLLIVMYLFEITWTILMYSPMYSKLETI